MNRSAASSPARRWTAAATFALLVVLFFGINLLADATLRGVRLDLTENRLYTLSQGTRRIVSGLDEPIRLTFFFSESLAGGRPALQAYGKRVRELLEEYALLSRGRIELEIVDPEPFSEAEDRARQAGLAGAPIGPNREEFYFGLLGVNSTDGREVIRFFDPGDERFLEYEVSRLVHNLSNPERKVVGVLSSLPLDGGFALPGQPSRTPWQIMREMRTLFDVRMLEPDTESIGDDVDVLLIVHPKGVEEPTLRAIDRFALSGRGVAVFVDPLCEADVPPGADQNPFAAMQADRASDLNTLLSAWGLRVERDQVAADMSNALRGRSPDGREVVPYVQYIGLAGDGIDREDAVTRLASLLQFAIAGSVTGVPGAATTVRPLVRTSDQSMLLDVQRVSFFPQPRELIAEFVPRGEPLTLAARVTGPARSAFDIAGDGPEGPAPDAGERAAGEVNAIVVADVDMLSDRMWVDEVRLGNMVLGYQKLSDNGDFLLNALDHLAGSSDLIAVRARGTYSRPFTLVEEIRRAAEQRYLAEAERLEQRRRETERRIADLQRARPDAGELILTPEQRAEIKRFEDELVQTNAQLRQVRYDMRKDVERLGVRLKAINIGAAPLLVALAALALGAWRSARRRADRGLDIERGGAKP